MSPGAAPAPPLKPGFELLVREATGVSVTAGDVVSTVKVDATLLAVLWASSDCSA